MLFIVILKAEVLLVLIPGWGEFFILIIDAGVLVKNIIEAGLCIFLIIEAGAVVKPVIHILKAWAFCFVIQEAEKQSSISKLQDHLSSCIQECISSLFKTQKPFLRLCFFVVGASEHLSSMQRSRSTYHILEFLSAKAIWRSISKKACCSFSFFLIKEHCSSLCQLVAGSLTFSCSKQHKPFSPSYFKQEHLFHVLEAGAHQSRQPNPSFRIRSSYHRVFILQGAGSDV